MAIYITLVNGIRAARLNPDKQDETTSAAVIAAALFRANPETGAPAWIDGVDLVDASITIGEYDLVIRYGTEDAGVPVRLSAVLAELVGGRSSTLTVVEDASSSGQSPSEEGLGLASDLQASGHDDAVRRALGPASGG